MIPYQYQAASMQNPQLARNIEEVVTNLKNLEICIDALRNDLVQVAESTGNVQAAQRLLAPASLALSSLSASPLAAAGASPWDIQSQLGLISSPYAQGAASPFAQAATSPYAAGISPLAQSISSPYAFAAAAPFGQSAVSPLAARGFDPYETKFSPFAQATAPWAASPFAGAGAANLASFSPAAASLIPQHALSTPWNQAHIQQLRLAELARLNAVNPLAQVSPFSAAGVPRLGQVSPYASTPFLGQSAISHATPQVSTATPFTQISATRGLGAPTAFGTAPTVGPF